MKVLVDVCYCDEVVTHECYVSATYVYGTEDHVQAVINGVFVGIEHNTSGNYIYRLYFENPLIPRKRAFVMVIGCPVDPEKALLY